MGGGGGGRLLTFSAFIRGWALIRINAVTKFYTIIGCLMHHEFGLGSYDTLVSFSATEMQTLQAKKRDDIVSNRSNSYIRRHRQNERLLRPSNGKMHEKEPV